MQIFSDEKMKEVMGKYLEGLEADCIIVDLEQPDKGGLRSTACGIGLVPDLAEANPNTPVIMIGWQTPEAYKRYDGWRLATSYKNVVLRRLPVNKDDILSAIAEVKERLTIGQ